MPSKARIALTQNLGDVNRLLELHQEKGGAKKGRRYGLEVLNKSAIVLLSACWEAYCEDLSGEALAHIVKHAKTSASLPERLRKDLARELKDESHDLAIWNIADEGWRTYLTQRLASLQEARNRKLNTPKAANIDQLFRDAIGLESVSASWRWSNKLTVKGARDKLDWYIELRGAIAHKGSAGKPVTKAQVVDFLELTKNLSSKTGGRVNLFVKAAVGKRLWT